jgi:hypothetical protein
VRAGQEEGVFLAVFDVDEIRNFRKRESWRMDYITKCHPEFSIGST